jgi:3-hydroxyacyl-CoA dehydrogenase
MAIKMFQDTMMRVLFWNSSSSCSHGMTLGGGCEMSLHADKVVAAAETYMGLVEFGVGLFWRWRFENWRCVHLIYSVKMMWN